MELLPNLLNVVKGTSSSDYILTLSFIEEIDTNDKELKDKLINLYLGVVDVNYNNRLASDIDHDEINNRINKEPSIVYRDFLDKCQEIPYSEDAIHLLMNAIGDRCDDGELVIENKYKTNNPKINLSESTKRLYHHGGVRIEGNYYINSEFDGCLHSMVVSQNINCSNLIIFNYGKVLCSVLLTDNLRLSCHSFFKGKIIANGLVSLRVKSIIYAPYIIGSLVQLETGSQLIANLKVDVLLNRACTVTILNESHDTNKCKMIINEGGTIMGKCGDLSYNHPDQDNYNWTLSTGYCFDKCYNFGPEAVISDYKLIGQAHVVNVCGKLYLPRFYSEFQHKVRMSLNEDRRHKDKGFYVDKNNPDTIAKALETTYNKVFKMSDNFDSFTVPKEFPQDYE
jgi:hypothetical protein